MPGNRDGLPIAFFQIGDLEKTLRIAHGGVNAVNPSLR